MQICPACGNRSFSPDLPAAANVPPWRRWLEQRLGSPAWLNWKWPRVLAPPKVAIGVAGPTAVMSAPATYPIGKARRVLLAALALVCVVFGIGYLADSAQSRLDMHVNIVPGLRGPGLRLPDTVHTVRQTHMRKENGINFAVGLGLLFAGLLAANRATKRRNTDAGAIDRLAGPLGGSPLWVAPLIVMAVAGGWFAYRLVAQTEFHWTAKSAASAFADVGGYRLAETGDFIYGAKWDSKTTHVAYFTPALVRELRRAHVSVGGHDRPVEYPMPGFLPIMMLAALAGYVVWRRRYSASAAQPYPGADMRHPFLAFGLINLYVMLWLVSAQSGVLFGNDVNPEWLVPAVLISIATFSALAALWHKAEAATLGIDALAGWMSAFFLAALLPVAWTYYFSDVAPESPVLLWFLLYLTVAGACWSAILPAGKLRVPL
jgi:hypothetical protein